ncbi:type III-B CRISPR module-associated protein Cmr5 [Candidatus Contubernalis alkaliaceticus]|uniref:type III-B CRISPR module-associated protein Cmr5 n=1 Tax=Candidatus Contubernalis alkaliaceticus TaxID=338645 RepID=UPI001F4C1063
MIQVNGLGQVFAFCFAKKGVYGHIFEQIEGWIREHHHSIMNKYTNQGHKDFMSIMVNMESRDYRIIMAETIALLLWMSRFADGIVKED